MADKKFKTGVDLQSTVKVSSAGNGNRALTLDASKNITESAVTDTELGHLSGVTSAVQTQLDAKADLVGGKIPSSQIPAVAIVEVFSAADIAARDALTIGSGDGEIQEGDVVIVTDASSDPAITSGAASYIYDGSAYKLLKAGDEVLSVNGEVGTVVLDADDISDAATTNKYTTAGDISKLAGIESGATADQSDAEIKTAYENNANTNAFTDAEKTLLGNQSGSNTGDEVTATQSVAGIAEVATVAEIDAQLEDDLMITPLGLAGSALQQKVDGIESGATADQTGAEIKSAYEGEADTNAYDDAAVTKLGGIEALADVTDATNVAAAGATMDADTSLVGNGYFLDEDDMSSDDATKVPSQQSVKAYVDVQAAAGGNLSAGDIKETSFSGAADTASNLDVTGLAFANGTVSSFDAQITVGVDATANFYETFRIMGVQKGGSWDIAIESVGDESQVSFSITAAGQVQYSKTTTAGWVSTTIKFRADTLSV